MKTRSRILVVEDIENDREIYIDALVQEGFNVDGAGNLIEALDRLDRKTYHAALVDIMLGGPKDTANRDGLKVLRRLQDLGEGTKSVVLSAQPEKKAVYDMLKEYGISDYIFKEEELAKYGLKILLDKVSKVLASCQIREYGKHEDILHFLAGEGNEPVWVSKCLRSLKPKGAYEGLLHFFEEFCKPLVPLLPKKDAVSSPSDVHESEQCVVGKFWSKGLGIPIMLIAVPVSKKDSILQEPISKDWKKDSILDKCEKFNLFGLVFGLDGVLRNEFIEKL